MDCYKQSKTNDIWVYTIVTSDSYVVFKGYRKSGVEFFSVNASSAFARSHQCLAFSEWGFASGSVYLKWSINLNCTDFMSLQMGNTN